MAFSFHSMYWKQTPPKGILVCLERLCPWEVSLKCQNRLCFANSAPPGQNAETSISEQWGLFRSHRFAPIAPSPTETKLYKMVVIRLLGSPEAPETTGAKKLTAFAKKQTLKSRQRTRKKLIFSL